MTTPPPTAEQIRKNNVALRVLRTMLTKERLPQGVEVVDELIADNDAVLAATEATPTAAQLRELVDVTEALMRECVKRVNGWHFPQYDDAARECQRARDLLAAAEAAPVVVSRLEAPTGQPAREWTEREKHDVREAMQKIVDREAAPVVTDDMAQRALEAFCKASMPYDENSEIEIMRAAIDAALNQCDGCRSGDPVDAEGFHRNPYMLCQRERYEAAPVVGGEAGVDAERREDMSASGRLRLHAQDDGDMCVMVIEDDGTSATVEFCSSGGRSPNTLQALRDLSRAMRADNDGRTYTRPARKRPAREK